MCASTASPCSKIPVAVRGITGATAISVGAESACALLSGGTVQCWGDNTYGQLGDGTTTDSSTAVAVGGITGATAISVGQSSVCAVLSGGAVECWGAGLLGFGTTSDTISTIPVAVSGLADATSVSVGYISACAVLSGGTVQCWADGAYDELGDGTLMPSATPLTVSGLTSATAVSVGDYFACALLSGGTVRCWGANGEGEVGAGVFGGSNCIDPPGCARTSVMVGGLTGGLTGATAISAGPFSTCALLSGGTVQCWGGNGNGDALGNGSATNTAWPVPVSGLSGATAVSVSNYSACALLVGGSMECWGLNSDGQLGDGTTGLSFTPVMVQ